MTALTADESVYLRELLTHRLTDIFAQDKIQDYLYSIDLLTYPSKPAGILSLKLATDIWTAMGKEDRFFVLDRFNMLCNGFKCKRSISQKTLIFCKVFIIELSLLLAESTQMQ